MVAISVVLSARNIQILYRISHTSFLQRNNSLCHLVSEEKIFFLNFSLSEKKKFPWRPCFLLNQDEMRKSLRWPYIDALCKILLYLAQLVVSEEKVFRNWTPRNKKWLWRPCLLTDRDKMNNLYRGPFHRCFLTKFRFIWTSGFREDFLLINQPETRFAHVRGHRGHDRIVVGFTTTCAISA